MTTSRRLQHVEFVMGTAVSIDIRPPTGEPTVLPDVLAWLHHVDATFSTYKEDSPISRLGRGEAGPLELTPEIRHVVERCLELNIVTDGAFDAWAVPAPNGTSFDPSGYVKGWAIERSAEMLELAGCTNFWINAGGDIALRGQPEEGVPWRVGIRHPDQPDRPARVLQLSGTHAVATSATYERGAHIIDPATGEPTTELASVTVVGPDLASADAYATATFVMGLAGLEWIDRQPGYAALMITRDETVHWSEAFDRIVAGVAQAPAVGGGNLGSHPVAG